MGARPRLLVSACLVGEAVRFDGGHRRSALVSSLGAHVDLIPVCPEVEAGLGTPRPSLRLVSSDGRLRMVSSKAQDVTEVVQGACDLLAGAAPDVDGALLKKGSPSCGPERVKIYGENGMPLQAGRGMFADALARRHPALPIEDEGRLQDADLRHSFLARLFTHARLRELFGEGFTLSALRAFHARHKLLLMAHSPRAYAALGRAVANAHNLGTDELREAYISGVMEALGHAASRGRHANVLQHIAGYVSRGVDAPSRQEIRALIAEFQGGLQPLAAPHALLRHHVRQQGLDYIAQQVYLNPYPKAIADPSI
jgi:uncharacterized protein YbgA (DUF1722 family)/uncharacterized protein YbbK (DUF523 family)